MRAYRPGKRGMSSTPNRARRCTAHAARVGRLIYLRTAKTKTCFYQRDLFAEAINQQKGLSSAQNRPLSSVGSQERR